MPRLSLYRPQKGNDYKFIDKTVWEMFQVGGTDVLVHKYIGPATASTGDSPTTPTYSSDSLFNIQDLLFLENRDRKYDPDIYMLRGVYNIQDIDFNLSQFGLFLQNDTIFITFHINDTVEKLGRKIVAGDVIELPHLKDEYALNDLKFALKRFYVIEEVNRAAEGFSVTWYPHLYRAKCKPLVDSQEFKDILDGLADRESYVGPWEPGVTYYPGDIVTGPNGVDYTVIQEVTGVAPPDATYYEIADSLRDIMSTYNREMQITQAVLDQAELDAPKSGYDTTKFYTLTKDSAGNAILLNADGSAEVSLEGSTEYGYKGYILEDGIPPNGAVFSAGIAYPSTPKEGQYCLRTDFMPNRLFRFNGTRWVKVEDSLRMTMNNLGASDVGTGDMFEGKEVRQTQKTSFINNDNVSTINGHQVKEKQSLSKALRPEADE